MQTQLIIIFHAILTFVSGRIERPPTGDSRPRSSEVVAPVRDNSHGLQSDVDGALTGHQDYERREDTEETFIRRQPGATDPEHISFGKMLKRGVKFVRRYIRQAFSDLPDNRKGGVIEVFQDIVN